MTPGGETRLAGVIGWPVRHSRSPALHNAAFAAAGLDWTYVAFPVPPGAVASAVDGMRALGIEGLSVTMPHKEPVLACVDRCTADAAALGAANTVFRDGDDLVGDSTDGPGFVDSLRVDEGIDPAGAHCVVVGAGGAARAVVRALAGAGADRLTVVNRSPDRAERAASLAGGRGVAGTDAALGAADLVVNATPLGMGDDDRLAFPVDRLAPHAVVVDLVYHPAETPILREAAARGHRTVGGIGMLLHQAARQWRAWTGTDPDLDAMRLAVADVGSPGRMSDT